MNLLIYMMRLLQIYDIQNKMFHIIENAYNTKRVEPI